MKQLDKTTLLFEMLLGTDMYNVNRKIDEVRMSPEYIRVSNYIPEATSSQLGADIKERFDAIDLYGVLSMQRILEVEKEIKELDRRIASFPSVNPYLSNGYERKYGVKKVGDIAVEISAQGMTINDFTTFEGVRATNRKKVLKHKLFGWYAEAKRGIADNIENSKLMLSRIRKSKFKIKSINFEFKLLIVAIICLFGLMLFRPQFAPYLKGELEPIYSIAITGSFILGIVFTGFCGVIHQSYKTFPLKVSSQLRRQIVDQKDIIAELDEVSYEFEKSIIKKSKTSFKANHLLKDLSVAERKTKISNSELFDYVYSEKEYYIQHKKKLLGLHNVFFAIALVCLAASLAILLII